MLQRFLVISHAWMCSTSASQHVMLDPQSIGAKAATTRQFPAVDRPNRYGRNESPTQASWRGCGCR